MSYKSRSLHSSISLFFICLCVVVFSACENRQNEGGEDSIKVDISILDANGTNVNQALSNAGETQASLITVVSELYDSISLSSYLGEAYDKQLLDLTTNAVSLSVPLNKPIRLTKINFSDNRSLDEILSSQPVAQAVGISNAFIVDVSVNKMTVLIDMDYPPTVTVAGISTWQNTAATPTVTCIDDQGDCVAATIKYKYYSSAQSCSTNYDDYTDSGTITSWQFVCVAQQDVNGNAGFTETAVEFKITSWIYVANFGRNSVSVIRGADNAVVDEITVGTGPTDLGVNTSTKKIYVCNYTAGGITVINGTTNTVSTSITLSGGEAANIAVNPVTNTIYVSDEYSNDVVYVINGATNSVTSEESTTNVYTLGIGINTTTNMIYVDTDSNVEKMNGASNTFTTVLPGPGGGGWYGVPQSDVEVNSTTNTIYSTAKDNSLDVFNGANDTFTTSVTTGTGSMGIAVNETTNLVYTANFGTNTVSKINGATNTWVKDITVGNNPLGIELDASMNRIYAVNNTDETVSVIDGDTDTVIGTIALPASSNPYEITILPAL